MCAGNAVMNPAHAMLIQFAVIGVTEKAGFCNDDVVENVHIEQFRAVIQFAREVVILN